MKKFFIKKIVNHIASFSQQDSNHILKVLRMEINDTLIGFYDGIIYECKIISLDPLRAEVVKQVDKNNQNEFEINVFQASIKPNNMEIAIRKCCELNVDNFYIFNTQYSQANIIHNLERYQKIIQESAKQCYRSKLMKIEIIDAKKLNNLLAKNDLNIIAHLNDKNIDLEKHLKQKKHIGIIIGPEGGFSPIDLKNIENNDLIETNLTKTILRSETACIYLCSVVSYLLLKG